MIRALVPINHMVHFGINSAKLTIFPNVVPGKPKFRFAIFPRGDIYESSRYEYSGFINPKGEDVEFLFEKSPTIKKISAGMINIAFEDAALRWMCETDSAANNSLTERIKKLEQRISILEKLR